MGVCEYIRKIVLLGPLYKFGTFKDRVHWVILFFLKVLLPFYLVLVSERSEVESYRHYTKNHYKDNMHVTCKKNSLCEYFNCGEEPQFSYDAWIPTAENFTDLNLGPAGNSSDTFTHESVAEVLRELIALKRRGSPKKTDKYVPTRKCCKAYSEMVAEKLECLDQGSSTSALTFTCAMFYPLMAHLFVAIVMIPLRSSRFIQRKLLAEGNRPSVQLTAEEKIRQIQNGVQYVADVLAFCLVVYKIMVISKVLKLCLSHSYCLPRYKSIQISFLLITLQTPWVSILWSFIDT